MIRFSRSSPPFDKELSYPGLAISIIIAVDIVIIAVFVSVPFVSKNKI